MRSLRRLIIVLAEIVQVFSLILWTVGGGWAGARGARIAFDYGHLTDILPLDRAIDAGMALGAFVGFVISATVAALVFAFAQIEVNTRELARYYMDRRKNQAAIDRAMKQPNG